MKITPHFDYNSKYDVIKCPCKRCRHDKIVRINPTILWIGEMIRAALNSHCFRGDEILLKVNSGSRCVKHHIDIYKKMGVPESEVPFKSRHVFYAMESLTTALDLTPVSKIGIISREQLLDEVEEMSDKDWPGGFHRYEDFFHIDLRSKKERW